MTLAKFFPLSLSLSLCPLPPYVNLEKGASAQRICLPFLGKRREDSCGFWFFPLSVPPMVKIQHQLIGSPPGYSVTLECETEAHPASLNYWTREDGHMIHDSKKYRTEMLTGSPSYITIMRLSVANIEPRDYGIYKCIAKNPRGETEGSIRLYGTSQLLLLKFQVKKSQGVILICILDFARIETPSPTTTAPPTTTTKLTHRKHKGT